MSTMTAPGKPTIARRGVAPFGAYTLSAVLTGVFAVALLVARDTGLALVVDVDGWAVMLAGVATLLAAAGLLRRRAGAPWTWPLLALVIAAMLGLIALTFRFGVIRNLDVQVPVADETRAAWMLSPRAAGPFPGLVLAGEMTDREALFIGRFLAERGLVVVRLRERTPDDLIDQAALASTQVAWLSERDEVRGRALGVMGAGRVAGLTAAVAPEVEFAVALVRTGDDVAEIWSQVHASVLVLAGGDDSDRLVDDVFDRMPVATALQAMSLQFDGADESLRLTPRSLPWPGLPRGFPHVVPVWITTEVDGQPPQDDGPVTLPGAR